MAGKCSESVLASIVMTINSNGVLLQLNECLVEVMGHYFGPCHRKGTKAVLRIYRESIIYVHLFFMTENVLSTHAHTSDHSSDLSNL